MIPILYEGTETQFTSNGLGRLADAISCNAVEEHNATYELEMTYPISGVHYNDLAENRIILAQPFDGGLPQPFIIYKITRPLNGIVTINAEHISYRLSGITVMPYSANSCVSALAGIPTNSAITNPFTFTTDKTTTGSFSVTVPTNARELLGGSEGSILDVYGKGDYEFDRFSVKLWVNRGADNNVTLRYGKNITELQSVLDMTNVYTGISPYWTDGGSNVKTLPEKVVMSSYEDLYPFKIIKPVDFSDRWENEPTDAQLRAAAQSYVTSNEGWKIKNNITVSFVALWNTEEYKNIAPLERVKMCDTVRVVYPKLGVNFTTRVIRTDYDVLQERYNDITLGDTYYTLNQVFTEEIESASQEQTSHMQKAIAHATALITGGLGGHVVMNLNADGEPQEILIMDTDSISTAVNVLRMNYKGIGFSTHGYNGPFNTAWTIDSHFYADYIDTGNLNADLLQVGRIQPIVNGVASANYWDMLTGDFHLSSTVQVGSSTVASQSDVSTAQSQAISAAGTDADSKIQTYDNSLNQLKVFKKLTNNGAAQGITLTSGNLYINATYIKSGGLIVGGTSGMIGSITVKSSDNSTVIGTWDKNGLDVKKGSIKGASLTVGGNGNADGYISVTNASGTEIGRWDNSGLDVKSGTITGATIQNAATGARVKIDTACSIKGLNGNTLHNFINFAQAISGGYQMTLESDNQMNIRTEKLCVVKGHYGENSSPVTVYETQNDTDTEYNDDAINTGRKCWRVMDVYKIMKSWPYANNPYNVQELDLVDFGSQGTVHVTLPVLLEVRYKKERRRLGMVTTENTYDSYVV